MEHFNTHVICFDSVLLQCIAVIFKVVAPIYSSKAVLQSLEILETYEVFNSNISDIVCVPEINSLCTLYVYAHGCYGVTVLSFTGKRAYGFDCIKYLSTI